MLEITIDEMIEYIKSLINDFKKISKIKPTKLEAILASLQRLQNIEKVIEERINYLEFIQDKKNRIDKIDLMKAEAEYILKLIRESISCQK